MVNLFGWWFEVEMSWTFFNFGYGFATHWRTRRYVFCALVSLKSIFNHFSKMQVFSILQRVNGPGHPRGDVTAGICQLFLLDFDTP